MTAAKLANEGVWPDEKRGWCLTPALAREASGPDTRRPMSLAWLEYVLHTGANWAGPIGHFRLEIAADSKGVVSACPIPGLILQRRAGTLIAERANFTPSSDIAVLFLSPGMVR